MTLALFVAIFCGAWVATYVGFAISDKILALLSNLFAGKGGGQE